MLTMRRSPLREQKKQPDVDVNSLIVHPPSSHASIAVMNTCMRSACATNGRDSITVPCIDRTTYQRAAVDGARGL